MCGGGSQAWTKACEAFLESKEIADWLTAANTIQQKLAPVDGPYRAFFVSKLGSLKAIQPAILDAIAKIASAKNRIATTNYDHLISQALNWDRADWTNHLRVIEALQRQASGGVAHPRRFRSTEFDHFLARRLRPDRRVRIAAIRAKIGGAGFHARFRRLLGIGAVGRQRRPPARMDAQGLRRPRRQTFRSRRRQQYRLNGQPASRLSASATIPIFRPISPSSRRSPSCPRGCRPIQK